MLGSKLTLRRVFQTDQGWIGSVQLTASTKLIAICEKTGMDENQTRRRCKPHRGIGKGIRRAVLGTGPATRILPDGWSQGYENSFNGLHGLVRDRLQLEPRSGHWENICSPSAFQLTAQAVSL
jgi:hypothetical protein